MSTEQKNPFELPASGDLSASVYCGVTVDATGAAILPSAGGPIVGVLKNKALAAGDPCRISGPGDGKTKLKLGGTVTAGDYLKVGADGRFSTASGGDVAAGEAVAIATTGGSANDIATGVLLLGSGATLVTSGGVQSATLGTDVPSNAADVIYVSTTATVTGALGNGLRTGQQIAIVQAVAASTPVGTITGAFADQVGTAKTTLALGTAVGFIFRGIWTGTKWRQVDALGGTASGLS